MSHDARVVVIGGGVAGCSLLCHLTRLGWSDVLLLEKDELTSGSTWHAAGLCTQFNPSYNLMKLLRYSIDLYEILEAETGALRGVSSAGNAPSPVQALRTIAGRLSTRISCATRLIYQSV